MFYISNWSGDLLCTKVRLLISRTKKELTMLIISKHRTVTSLLPSKTKPKIKLQCIS